MTGVGAKKPPQVGKTKSLIQSRLKGGIKSFFQIRLGGEKQWYNEGLLYRGGRTTGKKKGTEKKEKSFRKQGRGGRKECKRGT